METSEAELLICHELYMSQMWVGEKEGSFKQHNNNNQTYIVHSKQFLVLLADSISRLCQDLPHEEHCEYMRPRYPTLEHQAVTIRLLKNIHVWFLEPGMELQESSIPGQAGLH